MGNRTVPPGARAARRRSVIAAGARCTNDSASRSSWYLAAERIGAVHCRPERTRGPYHVGSDVRTGARLAALRHRRYKDYDEPERHYSKCTRACAVADDGRAALTGIAP